MGSAHHEAFGDLLPLEGIEPYKDRTTLSTIPINNGSGAEVLPVNTLPDNIYPSECLVHLSQSNGLCSPWSLWWLAPTWGLGTSTGSCSYIEPYKDKTTLSTIPTRLASSQWTRAWRHAFPFLFTTRCPIRQKVPWENQGKLLRVVGFRNNRVEDKGKTTGNRFDFEIAGLLWLNLVRNIEGPLCSEIPCLVAPRVARCLGTWSCFCAYWMTVTVPVSVRFSLTQTLQGEQYQFIEATIYPPLLLPESHRNWKFRNAESSQGHSRSHAVLRSHADWAKSLRLSRV